METLHKKIHRPTKMALWELWKTVKDLQQPKENNQEKATQMVRNFVVCLLAVAGPSSPMGLE